MWLPRFAVHLRDALDREVVRFGRAGGEDDLLRRAADQLRDLLARLVDGLLGFPAELVVAAGRIAEDLAEVRQHGFEHARVHRRRRVVVHVDRQRHAGGQRLVRLGDHQSVVRHVAGGFHRLCGCVIHRWLLIRCCKIVPVLAKSKARSKPVRRQPARGACVRLGGLDQVGDANAAQQVLDRVVHLAQWFFDGAVAVQVAGSVDGNAAGDEKRPVDRADHFKRGDLRRRPRQRVAAVGPGMRDQEAAAGERLQDFRQQLRRNVVCLGDILGRLRAVAGLRNLAGRMLGQVFEGHQPVVGFFRKSQHGSDLDIGGVG